MRKLLLLIPLLLFTMPAHALTYSAVNREALPVLNIYDTVTRDNRDASSYSFEELDYLLSTPQFRKWNNVDKVCQSMQIMFDRVSANCIGYRSMNLPPATARAYVSFEIIPPPRIVVSDPKLVVLTDPLTPPWPPTYQDYGPAPYSYWPW